MIDDMDGPGDEPAAARLTTCTHRGCSASTVDGKPFCPDHVALSPYAASVAARWKLLHKVTPGGTVEYDLGQPLPDDPTGKEVERDRRANGPGTGGGRRVTTRAGS